MGLQAQMPLIDTQMPLIDTQMPLIDTQMPLRFTCGASAVILDFYEGYLKIWIMLLRNLMR